MTTKQDIPYSIGEFERAAQNDQMDKYHRDLMKWAGKEIQDLREELLIQWNQNHFERCQNTAPHEGVCHWPKPKALTRD